MTPVMITSAFVLLVALTSFLLGGLVTVAVIVSYEAHKWLITEFCGVPHCVAARLATLAAPVQDDRR